MDELFADEPAHQPQSAPEPQEACTAAHVPARILEYRRGSFVAFAPHVTVALVDRPLVIPIPGAPYYGLGLIAWNGQQLPLLDLASLLRAYAGPGAPCADHVLILAFQPGANQPVSYGAVCAPYLVNMIEVTDSQQRELPTDSDLWPLISISCFEHQGKAVPILDTGLLFGQSYL